MERTQELFEKIEEYLAEALPPEEMEAFENEMAIDPALALEVSKQRELHRVLSDTKALEFRKKIENIYQDIRAEEEAEKEVEEATTKKRTSFSIQHNSSSFSYWKIAAAFIVLLGIGNLLWNNLQQAGKNSDLYLSHYVPYPAEDVTRGHVVTKLDIVMKQYANGEYQAVIGELEQLTAMSKIEQLRLYLGNSYLNTGKEKEAIQQFENVSDTSKFYEDATWYRALSYLKLGQSDKSIPILKEIISYNGLYREKAIQLMNKLEN